MVIAERDEMCGDIMQTKPMNDLNLKHAESVISKSSNNKISNKIITPKRTLILFVRDYLKEFGKISARGLARKHENIFRNTKRKPDKQLIKDFSVILKDLVGLGVLRGSGSSRGVPSYTKIINPDKLEGLKNE
jgi:Fe-S oxidoreductase